jgi:hypothetical protein
MATQGKFYVGRGRRMDGPAVSIYRFRDHGTIALLNNPGGGTLYLTARETRHLARELARLARSLEREAFKDSQFRNARVTAGQSIGGQS